ncbi:MAG: hypothetical protein ACYSR1_02775 [Planctomycetota bacterium]|jgi:hypothetical protein
MYERSILKSSQRVLALAPGELKNERWPLVADQDFKCHRMHCDGRNFQKRGICYNGGVM